MVLGQCFMFQVLWSILEHFGLCRDRDHLHLLQPKNRSFLSLNLTASLLPVLAFLKSQCLPLKALGVISQDWDLLYLFYFQLSQLRDYSFPNLLEPFLMTFVLQQEALVSEVRLFLLKVLVFWSKQLSVLVAEEQLPFFKSTLVISPPKFWSLTKNSH